MYMVYIHIHTNIHKHTYIIYIHYIRKIQIQVFLCKKSCTDVINFTPLQPSTKHLAKLVSQTKWLKCRCVSAEFL